jgi:hypothetical protein
MTFTHEFRSSDREDRAKDTYQQKIYDQYGTTARPSTQPCATYDVDERVEQIGEKDGEQERDQGSVGTPSQGAHSDKKNYGGKDLGRTLVENGHTCPMFQQPRPVVAFSGESLADAPLGAEPQ